MKQNNDGILYLFKKNKVSFFHGRAAFSKAVEGGYEVNVTGAAKKLYTKQMRFSIPDGLIQPAAGIVSQLVNFDSGVKAVSSKGKPFVGLGACPKSKKLNFGYYGEYTINTTRAANGIDWVLVGDRKVINKSVPCK